MVNEREKEAGVEKIKKPKDDGVSTLDEGPPQGPPPPPPPPPPPQGEDDEVGGG